MSTCSAGRATRRRHIGSAAEAPEHLLLIAPADGEVDPEVVARDIHVVLMDEDGVLDGGDEVLRRRGGGGGCAGGCGRTLRSAGVALLGGFDPQLLALVDE